MTLAASVPLQSGRPGVLWAVSKGRWPAEREITVPPLLCSCEALSAALHLGLGRDLYGTSLWREVGFFSVEKAVGRPHHGLSVPKRLSKDCLFALVDSNRVRGTGFKLNSKRS